jgi:hypothetical protein
LSNNNLRGEQGSGRIEAKYKNNFMKNPFEKIISDDDFLEREDTFEDMLRSLRQQKEDTIQNAAEKQQAKESKPKIDVDFMQNPVAFQQKLKAMVEAFSSEEKVEQHEEEKTRKGGKSNKPRPRSASFTLKQIEEQKIKIEELRHKSSDDLLLLQAQLNEMKKTKIDTRRQIALAIVQREIDKILQARQTGLDKTTTEKQEQKKQPPQEEQRLFSLSKKIKEEGLPAVQAEAVESALQALHAYIEQQKSSGTLSIKNDSLQDFVNSKEDYYRELFQTGNFVENTRQFISYVMQDLRLASVLEIKEKLWLLNEVAKLSPQPEAKSTETKAEQPESIHNGQ